VVQLHAIVARYAFGLEGRWRAAYVVGALVAETAVMLLFIIFGIAALRHFRPAPE